MKLTKLLLMILLALILAACSDETQTDPSEEPEETNNGENLPDNNGTENDPEDEPDSSEDEPNSSGTPTDLPENQLDLTLGDTAEIKTELDHYNVTLDAARIEEEINQQRSQLEQFVVLDVTVENIGKEPLKLEDVVFNIQVSDLDAGGGNGDIAPLLGEPEFAGELGPGEKQQGTLIFESYKSENGTYYMYLGHGFEAAGLMNKATWTFPIE